jgi:hypothetical protein
MMCAHRTGSYNMLTNAHEKGANREALFRMISDGLDPECGADGELPLSLFEAFATYPFEDDYLAQPTCKVLAAEERALE